MMSSHSVHTFSCTNCHQPASNEDSYCQACGIPFEQDREGTAKIGEIPFTYYMVLVSIFCACMMFYLPR